MPRTPNTSRQAVAVLAALAARPKAWRYGLSLSKETALKSGTLYPLLARMSAGGLLDAQWMPSEHPGRPPRHAYRLTAAGLAFAREHIRSRTVPLTRTAGAKA